MWEEPIFHNPMIQLGNTYSGTLQNFFVRAGIVTLGHLRQADRLDWKTPQQLSEESGVKSLRLVERLRGQVLDSLSASALHSFSQARGEEPPMFPALKLTVSPECHLVSSLMSLLSAVCRKMGVGSKGLYILGPCYSVRTKDKSVLLNFLFGQAKLATWLTRHNRLQGSGLVEPEVLFRGLVSARLRAEYEYYTVVHNLGMFQRMWCVDRAVCSLRGTKLLIWM